MCVCVGRCARLKAMRYDREGGETDDKEARECSPLAHSLSLSLSVVLREARERALGFEGFT